jgi:hypothetical protein
VFHFAALNFWSSVERSHRCPHANPQLGSNLSNAEALSVKLSHSLAVKDPLRAMAEAGSFLTDC